MLVAIFFIIRFRIIKFLLFRIRFDIIVHECNCDVNTIYHIQQNIFIYESFFKFFFRKLNVLKKITKVVDEKLLKYIEKQF